MGQPNFSMTLSTAWKSAPSRSSMWKPAKYGNSTRFTKNPGQSFTTTGVLPIFCASFTVAATAASEDCLPRMTSTSGIMCTGLKKCMPTKFFGRFRSSPR